MVPRVPESSRALTETVAVTGAGGYLGGRLVRQLAEFGHDLRALSRHDVPWLAVPTTIVDLTDQAALEKALAGASAVVHLAGTNEAETKTDPDRALAETVVAARRVGEAAAAAGVPRVVYVSTVHVYGAALVPGASITEDTVPRPRSVYAVARLAAEHLLSTSPDLEVVVGRLTNAVGPPAAPGVDRWSLVSNDLCRQAVLTGELRLRSDGRQWRDFVAVDDVTRIVAAAIDPARVPPGTYNLGSGRSRTVLELAELVQDAAESLSGTRPPLRVPPSERVQPEPYVIQTGRLDALGLRAVVPIREAITETVRFCRDHVHTLGD